MPHSFVFSGTYELPFGKGSTGTTARLLRGWTVNGILRYDSGRPLAITMNNDLAGLLFNTTKRPNRNTGTEALQLSRAALIPTATGTSTAARGPIRVLFNSATLLRETVPRVDFGTSSKT